MAANLPKIDCVAQPDPQTLADFTDSCIVVKRNGGDLPFICDVTHLTATGQVLGSEDKFVEMYNVLNSIQIPGGGDPGIQETLMTTAWTKLIGRHMTRAMTSTDCVLAMSEFEETIDKALPMFTKFVQDQVREVQLAFDTQRGTAKDIKRLVAAVSSPDASGLLKFLKGVQGRKVMKATNIKYINLKINIKGLPRRNYCGSSR